MAPSGVNAHSSPHAGVVAHSSWWASGLTLKRLVRASGLAGGFQRAVMDDFVATTEFFLSLAFLGKCLVAWSCYASCSRTIPRAQLMDVSWRGRSPG